MRFILLVNIDPSYKAEQDTKIFDFFGDSYIV